MNQRSLILNLTSIIAAQSFPISANVNTTPAGNLALKETLSVPTSATQLTLGGITQAAYVVIVNDDATNYINVSFENTAAVTPQVVQPGGCIVLAPASGAVIYAKANTAACQITYLAVSI